MAKEQTNGVKITSIIVGGIIILAIIAAIIFSQFSSGQTITANGQSSVKAVPNLITVNFQIKTSGQTAKEAKDANFAILDKLNSAMVEAGVNESDVKTADFSVYQDYSWENGKQVFLGYKATQSITIELGTNNTELVSVIDKGIDANATLSYINFGLTKDSENALKAEAIKLASEDAKTKATAMAEGLGKKLGSLVSVSDSNVNYYPYPMYANSDASASGMMVKSEALSAVSQNINPQEQDITGTVSVVYKIR